jgi:small subunit ribosomal protein S6
MLLFRPDLEDDKLQAAVEKVTRAIVNAGGTLTKVSPWGKRRLAYDILHFREASYFLLNFDIAPAAIRELERGMLISEEILRHLVTVLEDRGPLDEDELPPAAAARDDSEASEDGTRADEGESAEEPGQQAAETAQTTESAQTDETAEIGDTAAAPAEAEPAAEEEPEESEKPTETVEA